MVSKTNYFHEKITRSFEGKIYDEEIVTCVYQVLNDGELRFAGSNHHKYFKDFYLRAMEKLNPLSLTYLESKAILEKEMNNTKSWDRKSHNKRANKRLRQNPFIIKLDPAYMKKLEFQGFRDLEKFMCECLRKYGMYKQPDGSNDPIKDNNFSAKLDNLNNLMQTVQQENTLPEEKSQEDLAENPQEERNFEEEPQEDRKFGEETENLAALDGETDKMEIIVDKILSLSSSFVVGYIVTILLVAK